MRAWLNAQKAGSNPKVSGVTQKCSVLSTWPGVGIAGSTVTKVFWK